MSDVLFVTSSNKSILKYEVNGTMLLATKLLQAGVSTDVLRFYQFESYDVDYETFINDITQRILQRAPRCVSFYTLWPYYHIMLRIARELKKLVPEIITVMGGPQASATAMATMTEMDAVDYICTGEGENTVVPFFKTVLEGRYKALSLIPGLYYRQNGNICCNDVPVPLSNLNTLPHWDERLIGGVLEEKNLDSRAYFMPIDIGRGCPFSCTFCSSSRFWNRNYRMKTPERIIEDILYYREKYGILSFSFGHDAFTVNRKLVTTICDCIIAANLDINWKCTTRADCVSEELILKMKEAGMTHIELGVETGSERMQKVINKKLDLNKVRSTVSFLLKNGIHVALFFMYGFPEETEVDLNNTLELLFELTDMGVQYTSLSFCQFNPKSHITEIHGKDLVYDPQVKVLSRAVFGYEEEKEIIQNNKGIFPFFFHLNTPVRNEYQNLIVFNHWYKKFPRAIADLRKVYGGDNLRFYKDFCSVNRDYFGGTMDDVVENINNRAWDMMLNLLRNLKVPYIKQLKALLKYTYDFRHISQNKGDTTYREVYDFSYLDYRAKRPIEQYSDSSTEILIMKKDGKTTMRILSMK